LSRRPTIVIAVLTLLLLAAVALRLCVYRGTLSLDGAVEFFDLRSLRVAVALTVGAALAVSGVLLQALVRNVLASPDLLGVSAGASLAVVLAGVLGGGAGSNIGLTFVGDSAFHAVPAFVGAIVTLLLVLALGRRKGGVIDPVSLALTGVIVGVICGAGVMLVMHLSGTLSPSSIRVLVGSISDETRWPILASVAAATVVLTAIAVRMGPALDVLSMSDDEAQSVGVNTKVIRVWLVLMAGALAAGAVVLAGPVGFVGLVCPHAVRLVAGPRSRPLVIGAALAGAAMVVLADAVTAALDLPTGRLPLGVVTAVFGGTGLIIILRRSPLTR